MSRQTPTLDAVRVAFFNAMQVAVADDVRQKRLIVVPPAQDFNPDVKAVHLISALQPGMVQDGELGGREAIAPRLGVWIMTLSALKTESPGVIWRLAGKLEQAFRREDLPTDTTAPGGCPVYCEEPYTTNVGITPDKRIELSVTVPWWTWTGGETE